ncbi:uncharacterized protein CANTADRAFT_46597 [Suhomyces tanzawaensis NRRL Y-17324]|uniref:LisH domain-containing protein n=1 Tax=Suhomyces tanzawaensis NRRL Y-17324 TaxID=984487 RepID=A0A1E4SN91_9ASCO|nr:uncharacterized protein CANTADRAFT_46597 [Suhomyces tanzawaensis NRRL Y-17324]ODV80994.1 hypothetical protein CANTADRAFT_46597 [Suhomyces tanzawaensis NRRL Y-17324]
MSNNKLLRDLTFQARFVHIYGYDQDYYNFILKYREKWQKSLFYIEEKLIAEEVRNGGLASRVFKTIEDKDLNISDPELKSIDRSEFTSGFREQFDLTIQKGLSETTKQLKIAESVQLNGIVSRNAVVLNAGGQITSMKWLPRPLDDDSALYHYLAVSVIYNPSGVSDSIIHPELSVYHKNRGSNQIKSAIQLWRYDLNDNNLELEKLYITTGIGATSNLDWLPIHILGNESTIGVLVGTFTDGKLHLFKVSHNDPETSEVINSSREYVGWSNSDFKTTDYTNITTFDFLGHDKLLVGLIDGCLAEYVLPYHKSIDAEDDIRIPSSIMRIGDSSISALMVAEVEKDDYLIYVNTTGSSSLTYTYKNFIQGRAIPLLRALNKPSINPTLKMFVTANSIDAIAYNFYTRPHDTVNTLLKNEFYFTVTKLSEILGHPLNITGTTGGDIVIMNYTRKFLLNGKTTNKATVPLNLWNVSSENNQLKLSADYLEVPSESSIQQQVTPPETIISTLAWNENVTGSSVYTAGTIGGLLILERLDPAFA